jgi:heme/copper-type cytochrome/quinol oxidase subunit 2
MEIEQANRLRVVGFVVLIVALALIVAACTALFTISAHAAAITQKPVQKVFARMALLSAATLGLSLLLLLWAVMRFVSSRIRPPGEHAATPYVDAWTEAGKRFQLKKGEGEEEEDRGPK